MQKLEYARFPEEVGVSSQGILDYITARDEAKLEHHAIWVLRHGKVACKLNYTPYDDHTPHMLFSLSKSFCSAAAGFAVQEGLLNWDTKVIDVLPEAFPDNASTWLKRITLHHLLTMGSGLKPESASARDTPDWAKAVLAFGCDHEPGTHFHYNDMNTYLVSCMVQKVTGNTIRDYLVPRLFNPLGIEKTDGTAPDWDLSPNGINAGGWGLWLSCAQIALFGQCLLQKGMWDGKQVLPREWLSRAVIGQIDSSCHPSGPDWNMGYGYQFWMCQNNSDDGFTPRYRGDGLFSQFCIVDEKKDMVVCCVSGVPYLSKALRLIYKHLFVATDMTPADVTTQTLLQEKLNALGYPWPEHDGSPLPIGVYQAEALILTIEDDKAVLEWEDKLFMFSVGSVHTENFCAACCGMQHGELHLLLRLLNAPFTLDLTCRFTADSAELVFAGVGQKSKVVTLKKRDLDFISMLPV